MHFTNEVIDKTELPKLETVVLSKLDPQYWKVVTISIIITFLVLGLGLGCLLYYQPELQIYSTTIALLYGLLCVLVLGISNLSAQKKAFAFRTHDVIFKNGILATNTIVIPYNRVQHVALQEGFIARFFGLATVALYTAGGSSSDIAIPGIAKEQAAGIKQLLMGKIQNKL
ncbi:PH domain-containing protein [Flavobacterium crassostreae]|uniref:YdbS-like PH domain-containing protein n=1 Tax=Flavobacterium crassostreae TaxID=1763534 RepID=A0A1B9E293_9FLAO|nr:PH domain-containing protein [Flavobacterium crassostreae]OCB76064.1 hypothetical protein LPBF_07070 [Flavobacterium crassostreae]